MVVVFFREEEEEDAQRMAMKNRSDHLSPSSVFFSFGWKSGVWVGLEGNVPVTDVKWNEPITQRRRGLTHTDWDDERTFSIVSRAEDARGPARIGRRNVSNIKSSKINSWNQTTTTRTTTNRLNLLPTHERPVHHHHHFRKNRKTLPLSFESNIFLLLLNFILFLWLMRKDFLPTCFRRDDK